MGNEWHYGRWDHTPLPGTFGRHELLLPLCEQPAETLNYTELLIVWSLSHPIIIATLPVSHNQQHNCWRVPLSLLSSLLPPPPPPSHSITRSFLSSLFPLALDPNVSVHVDETSCRCSGTVVCLINRWKRSERAPAEPRSSGVLRVVAWWWGLWNLLFHSAKGALEDCWSIIWKLRQYLSNEWICI